MVELDGWLDYLGLFALAAFVGAVGGLAFELLQTRRGQAGMIERPTKKGEAYVDLGVIASVIVGAIAAVAALWIFPPEVTTSVASDGTTSTTTRLDIVKVVGLSLIIGSAGGSFLTALQARALALVKIEEAAATQRVARGQIEAIDTQIRAGASAEALSGAVTAARAAIDTAGDARPDPA